MSRRTAVWRRPQWLAFLLAGCSESAPTPPPTVRTVPSHGESALLAWIGEVDRELAQRDNAWFSLNARSTAELIALRTDLSGELARHRGGDPLTLRRGRPSAIIASEESSPAVDGSNYPSIKNQKIDARTWIVRHPSATARSWIGQDGKYSGTVRTAPVSGTLAWVEQNLSEATTTYAMPITYDATRDTVSVSSTTSHRGWFEDNGTRGNFPPVSKTNQDRYEAPLPPPPPPPDDGGGGGGGGGGDYEPRPTGDSAEGGGTIYCYYVTADGGKTWHRTNECWVEYDM